MSSLARAQSGSGARQHRRPPPSPHLRAHCLWQQQRPRPRHAQQQQQQHRPQRQGQQPAAAEAGAAAAQAADADLPPLPGPAAAAAAPPGAAAAALRGLSALYRFSRPHTMLGTAISVCSVSALAAGGAAGAPAALRALGAALSSALLMNVCIVGINQLYDIEIDRVNKPYLPLAAGDFSPAVGAGIVAATGAASLAIAAAAASPPLLATVGGSLLLGIAYSTDLPLLRWKRSPVLAAACILAVRAVLVQLGFYLHMQRALGAPAGAPLARPVLFATVFMLLFSVVIALFKASAGPDIPDVVGDQRAGVRTLSVRLGPRRVFWVCIALLELAYALAIGAGLGASRAWACGAAVGAHAALGVALAWRAARTDLTSSRSIYKCYMFVWALFYAEYMLLPLFA
eukprot:scaffold12.g8147.t1